MKQKKQSFAAIDRLFGVLDEKVKAKDASAITDEEKVVFYIWAALGLIENGGFQYLIENDIDLRQTALACDQLGLPGIASVFIEAKQIVLECSEHESWGKLLAHLRNNKTKLNRLDNIILDNADEIESRTVEYVERKKLCDVYKIV